MKIYNSNYGCIKLQQNDKMNYVLTVDRYTYEIAFESEQYNLCECLRWGLLDENEFMLSLANS